MADDDTTRQKSAVTLSTTEIRGLADRLQSRADAIENIGTADLVRDLRLMAKVVRAMLCSFNSGDSVTVDNNGA